MSKGAYAHGTLPGMRELFRRNEMNQARLNEAVCALGRPLTPKEDSVIKWLLGWENETVETIDGLFSAFFKAGQADANLAHDALSDQGEVQRLRSALEQITTVLEDSPVKTYQRMEQIANQALSSSPDTGDTRKSGTE